jgi:hypothetical protein
MNTLTLDGITRLYGYGSHQTPNSGLNSTKFTTASTKAGRNIILGSPKNLHANKNSSQVMSTATMMSFFNNMSKQVKRQLNGSTEENSRKNILTSQKNMKILRKQGKVLQSGKVNSSLNTNRWNKRESSQNKSKLKLSTRQKQKSSHRNKNNHKGTHNRSHFGSLDHIRAINKHLHQASLLENIKEGNSSYEADPQFATMNHHLKTMNSDNNLDYGRHMQDHREQEMIMMLNEEQKRNNEIEELMNIEEKLERNYKYYEKVK